eukprot:596435-Amphidinium_carterae.1
MSKENADQKPNEPYDKVSAVATANHGHLRQPRNRLKRDNLSSAPVVAMHKWPGNTQTSCSFHTTTWGNHNLGTSGILKQNTQWSQTIQDYETI